jgi:hypothetical protein
MTEAEWLESSNPQAMLEYLRGYASDRKLRLFACACCRCLWKYLIEDAARNAVEVAERFADGLADDEERSAARKGAHRASQARGVVVWPSDPKWMRRAASAAYYATARSAAEAAWNTPQLLIEVLLARAAGYASCGAQTIRTGEQLVQAATLREIFGDPFRRVTLATAWRTPDVMALTQHAYDERAFDRLPILADALEDAGCTDAAILEHCRGPGPHVRGCWVVDLLLGKS